MSRASIAPCVDALPSPPAAPLPMKVAVLTASTSRLAGGLQGAVYALCASLGNQGCKVEVLTARDAYTGEDLAAWRGVAVRAFPTRGPAAFGYQVGLTASLLRGRYDVLHTHGQWMYQSVAATSVSRSERVPSIVSPHGMLDPWALRNAAWKKRLAGWLYENRHLRRAACIHALCEAEYQAIRAYGLRNPVAVIPNGVTLPAPGVTDQPPTWAHALPPGSRVLLFLGRLHPKKNLPALLQAWAAARAAAPRAAGQWHLVVAGWDQGGHQGALERQVGALGLGASVHFVGPQFGAGKTATLARADAFTLPSLSEGLPMAVLEAWAFAKPVLMTPECNLPEGFASDAAIPSQSDATSLQQALNTLIELPELELRAMGARGRRLVERQFNWERIGAAMAEVYRWAAGGGPRPECLRG